MRKRLMGFAGFLVTATGALALQPQPLIKEGGCPSGYSQSGNYCTPGSNARFAIPKDGSCPSGYSQSGNYCVAGSNARFAIPKRGSCPSGYTQSGNYCLSGK